MKKLMVIAAVAVSAICSQAATVSWTCTNVSGPDGKALGTGHAYLFMVPVTSGKADTTSWAGLDGKGLEAMTAALAGADWDYKFSDLTGATAGTWTYTSTQKVTLPTNEDLGVDKQAGQKWSPYLVIFNTDTVTADSKYMVTTAANGATVMDDSAGTTKQFLLGNQSTASGTWYAVGTPEPTSGLLLLLGFAGLALKRKRA